jgi:hypothetical protein
VSSGGKRRTKPPTSLRDSLVAKTGVVGAGLGGRGKRDPPTSPRDSLVAVEVGGGWKMTNKATNEA